MVLRLCREFKKLPSEIYAEDTELIRMLLIEKMGTRQQVQEEEEVFDGEQG